MNNIQNQILELKKDKDITIEQIGSWLWVTGDTYSLKESLKNLGFFFSGSKKAWFWNGQSKKSRNSFCKDLNEIKERYPVEVITNEKRNL